MLWIERLIVESEKQKLFDVAPPVLSRAFQELSNGAPASERRRSSYLGGRVE